MMRSRILAAATAGVLMFGMSVGGAGAAFAEEAPLVETPIVEEAVVEEAPPADESRIAAPAAEIASVPANIERVGQPDDVGPPEDTGLKVFVCKYVGTPGVDEVLQTGNNPISVSVNAIPDYDGIGSYFADQQGRSYVLGEDTSTGGGQEGEPDVSECPGPDGPEEVTPSASAEQIDCLEDELIGGVITVDLTKMGVDYTIEDSNGEPVLFDGTSGETDMLEPGDYTVFGVDADDTDTYAAEDYEESFTVDEFTDECGDDEPTPVTPSASAEQIDCLEDELIGGVITVDLTKMGVDYTIEDSNGEPVLFDGTSGETDMLEPGDYTVFGVDADDTDTYAAEDYEESFTVDEFTDDCGELEAVVVPEVTYVDECVDLALTAAALEPFASFTVTGSPNVSYSYTVNGGPSIAIVVADDDPAMIAVTPGDTIVVTAVAAEGFTLPKGYEPWTYEFTNSELCVDLPPLANWEVDVTGSDQTCETVGLVSGTITVVLPVGPEENPNPVKYFINYDAPGEQELTSAETPVAPGDYIVTAVATDPADSINDEGNTAEFEVTVGAAADQDCELETLAFTGAGEFANWLGVLAVLMTVAGVGFMTRRHRVEV